MVIGGEGASHQYNGQRGGTTGMLGLLPELRRRHGSTVYIALWGSHGDAGTSLCSHIGSISGTSRESAALRSRFERDVVPVARGGPGAPLAFSQ